MSEPTLDVRGLDAATRSALRRLVVTLADSKRLMGIRYSDWLLGAPSIEAGIAASSMAQDEWGHARLLYAMLKDLDEDPLPVEYGRDATAYASVDALDHSFPDWAAVVAGIVVVDGALTVALDACSRGCFEPAGARVPKMTSEEVFHRSLGEAWYRRLAQAPSEEAKTLLRGATLSMLPGVLAWLGADDEAARSLVAAGITSPATELVSDFRNRIREVVDAAGVDVDAVTPAEAWDGERGRGPGHPDEEAVERARGDRNRMLFVE
ncbi:MAG: phenylacetate-CoA oxygenase subunit PaaI [Gemmatimonadota bacterium]|jgi:1,2-phenylacetyl-CoA epoxidase catalytic subunit